MQGDEALTFLTELPLPPNFDKTVDILSRVLVDSLGAREQDSLLIISDTGWEGKRCAPLLTKAYVEAAKQLSITPLVVLQSPKSSSETANSDVVESLNTFTTPGIVIALLSNKLGDLRGLTHSYRKLLTARKQRYATTPSLGFLPTEKFSLLFELSTSTSSNSANDTLHSEND